MGRNHIRVALATTASTGLAVTALYRTSDASHVRSDSPAWSHVHDVTSAIVSWFLLPWGSLLFSVSVTITCALVLVMIGSVMPDMDQAHSTFGKYFHVPLKHRGWTHSNWAVIFFFFITYVDPTHMFRWLWLGYVNHLVMDELSHAGRVHWYPLSSYKVVRYGTEQVIVKRKWSGFYNTNKSSETKMLFLVLSMSVFLTGFSCWYGFVH